MSLSRRWILSAAGAAFIASFASRLDAQKKKVGAGTAGSSSAGGSGAGGSGYGGGGVGTADEEEKAIIEQYLAALEPYRKKSLVGVEDAAFATRLKEIYDERFRAKFKCNELTEETLRRLRWQAYLLGALTVEMWQFEKKGICEHGGSEQNVKINLKHLDWARDAYGNITKKGATTRKAIDGSKDPKARKSLAYSEHQCPMC